MELEQALSKRFSTRKFLPRQVPRADIERILELAQKSASWCNTQPWQLIIVSGEALERFRTALFDKASSGAAPDPDYAFPARYAGEAQKRRVRCAVQLYGALGITREDRAGAQRQALENFRLFGAPHVALVTTDENLGFWGGVDVGIYLGAFTLAAQSVGVDTILQAALANYPGLVREHFGIAEGRRMVCGISFGYADPAHPVNSFRTERAPIAAVARWES